MSTESFIKTYMIDDEILVVKLHGDLDAASTSEFNAAVQKHLDEGLTKMIIDCANLGFISSLGVGALVTLQTRLRKRGGEVKLAAIQSLAAQVFRVVHLDKVLNIYGDIEFARQSWEEK